MKPLRAAMALALTGGALTAAQATNGYFPHGFGIKAQGMGGAAIATANDAFSGVNNPAGAAFVGNQWEVGSDLFSPRRSMTRTDPSGMLQGAFVANESSGRNYFLVPEFGYNRQLSSTTAVGLTVYGNGGMNTTYPGGNTVCPTGPTTPPAMGMNALCGQGKLGVDLMQLIVAPTVAYKLTPEHSVGVSPLFVLQRFEAYGLQGFSPMSANPNALTNRGKDSSTGIGVRLGYLGKLSDRVSVGVSFSPKISMSRFDRYAGLFAEQGKFDIPANYGVGAAFQLTPSIQLATDYTRINYSKVPSIGNPASLMTAMGASNGGGFGWRDVETLKVGVQWKLSEATTLRFGVNRGTNPVTPGSLTPNILAPGVMQTHWTVGGTHSLSKTSDISWMVAYAPRVSVSGPSLFNGMVQQMMGVNPNMQETVRMKQTILGVQYTHKF